MRTFVCVSMSKSKNDSKTLIDVCVVALFSSHYHFSTSKHHYSQYIIIIIIIGHRMNMSIGNISASNRLLSYNRILLKSHRTFCSLICTCERYIDNFRLRSSMISLTSCLMLLSIESTHFIESNACSIIILLHIYLYYHRYHRHGH